MVKQIKAELFAEVVRTKTFNFVSQIGIQVPEERDWSLTIAIGCQTKAPALFWGENPEVRLEVEGGQFHHWDVQVRTPDGFFRFYYGESLQNDLNLVPPKSPQQLHTFLWDAEAKLGLKWNITNPFVSLSGFRAGKKKIENWVKTG